MEFKEDESSEKTCSKKAIIVLIIFVFFIIASIIVIVVLVKKTKNEIGDYYLSEKICETDSNGREICYRKINVNVEHYIQELSGNVKRTHVRYDNRYGITLAADLYTPKSLDKKKKYKGLVIGPPYGGVKEQGPSVYANYFAQHDFVVVAFDPSFNGESGGKNRKVSSSDIFMEDFSASVDYLGTLSYVDREKIGAIGICGSGGFLLGAATIDKRIKAIVTVSLYDIPEVSYNKSESDWEKSMDDLKNQRWDDVDKGTQQYEIVYESDRVYENNQYPIKNEESEIWCPFYSTERGHHARSTGGFTFISGFSILNLQVTRNIEKIRPRQVLLLAGSEAHSINYTYEIGDRLEKDFYNISIVPGASHIDLYDNIEKIPFKDIFDFLNEYLNKNI